IRQDQVKFFEGGTYSHTDTGHRIQAPELVKERTRAEKTDTVSFRVGHPAQDHLCKVRDEDLTRRGRRIDRNWLTRTPLEAAHSTDSRNVQTRPGKDEDEVVTGSVGTHRHARLGSLENRDALCVSGLHGSGTHDRESQPDVPHRSPPQ